MRTSIMPDGGPPSLSRPDLNVKASTTSAERRLPDDSSRASIRPLFPSSAPLTEATDTHDVQLQNTPFPAEMEVAKGTHCLDGY
jgi:hypothetical protein